MWYKLSILPLFDFLFFSWILKMSVYLLLFRIVHNISSTELIFSRTYFYSEFLNISLLWWWINAKREKSYYKYLSSIYMSIQCLLRWKVGFLSIKNSVRLLLIGFYYTFFIQIRFCLQISSSEIKTKNFQLKIKTGAILNYIIKKVWCYHLLYDKKFFEYIYIYNLR